MSRKNSETASVRLEPKMNRAFTAPPPIKDDQDGKLDEEHGGAGPAPPTARASPVKEVAAEGSRAERGSAGTPTAARRQGSFTPSRSMPARERPSPKHVRRASQQQVCHVAQQSGVKLRTLQLLCRPCPAVKVCGAAEALCGLIFCHHYRL